MKKILFVHDHLFYDLNGKIYSSGGLSRTVWERFENFYDEIEAIPHNLRDILKNSKT